jgi:hypothetical protein
MINVNRYNINYTKLVTERIPHELRFDELLALMLIFVSPVVFLYNLFINYRNFILYKIKITPQVCYMEKMLNDSYDASLRRIYLTDGLTQQAIFIYTEPENKPVYVYTETEALPLYNYLEGETTGAGFDFVVNVPLAVGFQLSEMTARVNEFKLAGKTFKIQTF